MLKTRGVDNPSTSILLFDRFRPDLTLPKFRDVTERRDQEPRGKIATMSPTDFSIQVSEDSDELMMHEGFPFRTRQPGVLSRIRSWWRARKARREEIPPERVMEMVKLNPEELVVFQDRQGRLLQQIHRAAACGQHSLAKELIKEWDVRKSENLLYAKGFRKVVTEAQLLKYVEKAGRGLCLDWLSDFIRLIPEEAAALKGTLDAQGLFDNYAVLYTDPNLTGTTREAQEAARREEARKKDPILFGLLRNSRKLYFVADWVDEYCDLTLAKLVEVLGESVDVQ